MSFQIIIDLLDGRGRVSKQCKRSAQTPQFTKLHTCNLLHVFLIGL